MFFSDFHFKMTKGGRELQLNKRDQFFADPIFQDILAYDDKSLQNKLGLLKARNLNNVISTQPNLRGETAHNLQVRGFATADGSINLKH